MNDSQALTELLENEAQALRRADYSALEDMSERKMSLIEALSQPDTPPDPETARRLQDLLRRNEALYEATMGGLRSVIDRLKTVARVSSHLDTYTAAGAIKDLGPARSSFEKRS
jgi:flagellar biosynthesis/type III secretory pathway chaperone